MKKQINDLLLKMQTGENCIGETANALLNLYSVGKCKLNTYHIETQDTTGCFNFFTSAKSHKKALKQLLKNSSDYKNIVKANRDLTITIKRIDKTE